VRRRVDDHDEPAPEAYEEQQAGRQLFPQPGTEVQLGQRTAILIAEDHEAIRQLVEAMLRQRGWEVTAVADGAQAVSAWSTGGVSLILMDVHMPVMDGLEATRRIRQAEEGTGRHTPIIALTVYARREDWERSLAAGMDDYLTKPINRKLLLATIDRYMPPESGR
jgi:two-component system, sensor histidine kinase and response regulator